MFRMFTLEIHSQNYKIRSWAYLQILPTIKQKPWYCTRTVKDWRWGEQGQMEHTSATVNLWPWQGWMWERFSFISCKYLWAVSQPDSGGWEVVNISGRVSKTLLLFFFLISHGWLAETSAVAIVWHQLHWLCALVFLLVCGTSKSSAYSSTQNVWLSPMTCFKRKFRPLNLVFKEQPLTHNRIILCTYV